MGRIVVEVPVSSRNARAKLVPGLYWRSLDADTHLGYRKTLRAGAWLVRWRSGRGYKQSSIATADDALEADGATTLTFSQAESAARRHVTGVRADDVIAAAGPIVTIKSAIDEYLEERGAREQANKEGTKGMKRDARSRLQRYVLSDEELANLAVAKLTTQRLVEWRAGLPTEQASATKTRLASDFRAALNRAARVHRSKLPGDVSVTIKHGFASEQAEPPKAREAQVLADPDVRRIVAAAGQVDKAGDWDGALARLIIVLAATGARFSQVIRMSIADVQASQCRLMIPTSRKGRGVKRTAKTGVRVGDDVLAALRPAMAGRRGVDALFIRPRWKQFTPTVWTKVSHEPWSSASELTRPWVKILAAAELPVDLVPYCLRHSSIVRGLGAGLPVRLVASLHDTSSAMIEAHYSAFIVDAMDDLAARAVVPMVSAPVAPLRSISGEVA